MQVRTGELKVADKVVSQFRLGEQTVCFLCVTKLSSQPTNISISEGMSMKGHNPQHLTNNYFTLSWHLTNSC